MKKKIIKWILVLLWMGLIFYFSSRNRYESTDQSRGVLSKTNIVELFKEKTGLDLESATRIIDKIIRKVAHVVEFVVLSLLICGALSEYNLDLKKILIISFIVCFIYSCSDEAHQLLVSGRSGEIKDIIIDSIGSIIGIMTYKLYRRSKV